MRRLIEREFRGTQKRHLASGKSRRLGDVRVVGSQDEAIERTRPSRRVDCVLEQRPAGEQFQVLARDAFRPAPGSDDAKQLQCRES